VEDGTDQSNNIHEADLSRHLSNPKDAQAGVAVKSEASSPAKDAAQAKLNEKKYAEAMAPIEPASKEDLQFAQAMNFLKGKPVIKSEPPKVEAAASK
jgi:carboxyl-terminal processing protease